MKAACIRRQGDRSRQGKKQRPLKKGARKQEMEVGNPVAASFQATSLCLGLTVGSVAVHGPGNKTRPGHPPPLSFLTQLQDHSGSERAKKVTPDSAEMATSGTQ